MRTSFGCSSDPGRRSGMTPSTALSEGVSLGREEYLNFCQLLLGYLVVKLVLLDALDADQLQALLRPLGHRLLVRLLLDADGVLEAVFLEFSQDLLPRGADLFQRRQGRTLAEPDGSESQVAALALLEQVAAVQLREVRQPRAEDFLALQQRRDILLRVLLEGIDVLIQLLVCRSDRPVDLRDLRQALSASARSRMGAMIRFGFSRAITNPVLSTRCILF